jgi:hypothetical protein
MLPAELQEIAAQEKFAELYQGVNVGEEKARLIREFGISREALYQNRRKLLRGGEVPTTGLTGGIQVMGRRLWFF